jgi:putative ABC transport system substrate-binding protein
MRRFFVTVPALLVVLLTFTSTVETQAAPNLPRLGILCAPTCTGSGIDAFWDELRKLGWVEGTNIIIDRKEAGSHLERLPALAKDLVQSKPDLIVATSSQSARAAKDATSEIPIAIFFVADPIAMGLASSLARPGGNLTGAATFPGDFNGKAFEILRELLPQAKRLAAFINPLNETHQLIFMKQGPLAATKLGFQLDTFELRNSGEVPSAVTAAKARAADALYVVPDAIFGGVRIFDLAAQVGLPSMSLDRRFAEFGGLISYGPDFTAVARLGAHYVDRILRGAKPADLPIEQPSRFFLVINLKTAKSLGLEVPASLLSRADEVIE